VYQQVLDPVGGSLAASALVAMIPLATLFVQGDRGEEPGLDGRCSRRPTPAAACWGR
jgi:hypothetical protein